MNDSAKFCIICGKKNTVMSDGIYTPANAPVEQPGILRGQQKSMNHRARTRIIKILLIGVPVLALLVAVTAAMFALRDMDQKDNDSPDTEQHETTEETADTEKEHTSVQIEESKVVTTAAGPGIESTVVTTAAGLGIESTVGEYTNTTTVEPRIQAVPNSEVETQVLHVREVWNAYRTSIEDKSFARIDIEQGVYAYSNGSEIVTIEADAGYNNSAYARIYTYENGKLIFAFFYNDNEENRLYIKSDQLYRWGYTLGSSDPVNYDNTSDYDLFLNWESTAIEEGNRLLILANG